MILELSENPLTSFNVQVAVSCRHRAPVRLQELVAVGKQLQKEEQSVEWWRA